MISPAPPRPRAHPLLGSALDLRRSQIRTYERVMREQGDVVGLVVGPPGLRFELYLGFHPDGVKAVLGGSREAYSKGNRFYKQIAEAFGWGLVTSEGELWRRQRRLIQPLFTRREIATYSALMAEEAAAVAERWDRARNGVDPSASSVTPVGGTVRRPWGVDPQAAASGVRRGLPLRIWAAGSSRRDVWGVVECGGPVGRRVSCDTRGGWRPGRSRRNRAGRVGGSQGPRA